MRMMTNARSLLQMLAVLSALAIGSVMSQTSPAAPVKASSAKTETCSFVPASADGKEQICIKAGAKVGGAPKTKVPGAATVAATSRKPGSAQFARVTGKPANRVAKTPGEGLALKSATALKTPPIASAVEPAANQAGTAAATPSPTPAAKVQPAAPVPAEVAAVTAAVAPLVTSATAPTSQQSATPVAAGTAAEKSVATTATDTVASTPKATPGARKLRSEEAARRYIDGQDLERKGDPQAALLAYLVAAESGYGLAQKRLGDIYGTGTAYAERDYGLALKWYERARAQGIEIPKPFTYSGLRP